MKRQNHIIALLGIGFMLFSGCTSIDRSMVFTTGTTIGLDISTSAVDTQPVKLTIGYKRLEAVLNPVYDKGGISGNGSNKYRPEAYSVVAKFVGAAGGNTGAGEVDAEGNISAASWFATGEAAKNLSKQPGIAGAVSGNAKVAEAAAEEAGAIKGLTEGNRRVTSRSLKSIFDYISANAGQAGFDVQIEALNSMSKDYPQFIDFDNFDYASSILKPLPGNDPVGKGQLISGGDFYSVLEYRNLLQESIEHIKEALDDRDGNGEIKSKLNFGTGGTDLAIKDTSTKKLVETVLSGQSSKLDAVDKRISEDKRVKNAVEFFAESLIGD